MSERSANVVGGVCGILFVVGVVVGFGVLVGVTPHAGDSPQVVAEFLERSEGRVWAGGVIGLLGVLLYLPFVGRLWSLLRAAEGGSGWLSLTALAAALVGVAVILAGDLAAGAAAYYGGNRGMPPETAGALFDLREFAEVTSKGANGVFFAAAAMLAGRVLPRWLGWTAGAIAVIIVLSLPFGPTDTGEPPNFLAALWVLAVGVVLIVRRGRLSAV